jgi:hypothetical protein
MKMVNVPNPNYCFYRQRSSEVSRLPGNDFEAMRYEGSCIVSIHRIIRKFI